VEVGPVRPCPDLRCQTSYPCPRGCDGPPIPGDDYYDKVDEARDADFEAGMYEPSNG
jgi:hypothetical protein